MAQPIIPPCDRARIDAEPCPREAGREIAPNQRRLILVACILASSMAFIDGSALTVALPALRADLAASLGAVQWVLNGYILALAGLTLTGGALADHYGRARILAAGAALFGVFSIGCAIAPNAEYLIAARIGQGAGAALLTPASLALIGAVYPKAERGAAIGAWAAASALTTAGGPFLGGVLTETFGWPSIFWINPPIAIAVILILRMNAPAEKRPETEKPTNGSRKPSAPFDLPGAALLTLALTSTAFAISALGPGEIVAETDEGTGAKTSFPVVLAAGAAAVLLFAAFLAREARAPAPLTPPRLFQNRAFNALNGATLLLYAGLSMMFFLAPFELTEERGLSPSIAGATFLPFTLGVGFLSRLFGALSDACGRRLMAAGALAAALAHVLFILLRNESVALAILAPMGVLGVGFAMLVAPLTAGVMSAAGPADEGLASGVNNTASRIAQLLGVSLAAAVGGLEGGYATGLAIAAATSLAASAVIIIGAEPATSVRN